MMYYQAMDILTLEEIKIKTLPILKEAGITKASLFGSYVRGDQTDKSDVDILVSFPEDTTLIDVARLKRHLENQLNKQIDLVSYKSIHPLLKDEILSSQYPVL